MVTPLVTQQIDDLTVAENDASTTFDLTATFDDPSTTGQIARFQFAENVNDGGVADVLLFDQEGVGAPATVANFLNYVGDEDYDDTIIHRSVPGFIIQGGGFEVTNSQITEIDADDPVDNEFSTERSNLRGTIAMAKLGGDPDSATNQWFFNLGDNSGNLDNQNGGFTAFGQVLNEEDLEVIDAIAGLSLVDGDAPPASTFDNLPITDTTDPINTEDLVFLESVSLISEDELDFNVTSSNEGLVEASITENGLVLDYLDGQSGEATITVEATNLLGESVEEEFLVTVEAAPEPEPEAELEEEVPEAETPEEEAPEEEAPEEEAPEEEVPEEEAPVDEIPEEETLDPVTPEPETPELETPGSSVFRFFDPDTGIHFYADSESERSELESSQPDYISEAATYRTVDPLTGDSRAQEVVGLLNQDTGAYLYTTSENELSFIEDNLDNYSIDEDQSFFAFAEEQAGTIPIYRFLNTDTDTHFFTASEAERQSIEDSLPNYNAEGIAFYAFDAGE
ncbi:MAG: peptidylprolyl isomerase [Cyanobacteria bacterium J06621_12]